MSTLKTNNIQHVDRSDPSIIINTDGSVNVAGVLTYEDVTSVDSIGIVTARGLSIFGNTTGLNVASGISTFQAVTGTTGTFSGDVSIADKIIHTGNSGAAIRFPTDNTFTIETGGSEKVRVTGGGDFGLGTNSPAANLSIHETSSSSASSQLMRITTANGGLFGIETDETVSNPTWKIGGVVNSGSAEPLAFYQVGSEILRIDSDGKLKIGTTATPTQSGAINVFGTDQATSQVSIRRGSADGNGPRLHFQKSRNTTDGSHTVVQNDDVLGQIVFAGNDGQGPENGARISAEVDHDAGGNDMPTRLVFAVTPNGSDTLAEIVKIREDGRIDLGVSGPSSRIDPSSSGSLDIEADPGSNFGSSVIRFKIDGNESARMAAGTHKFFGLGRTSSQSNARMDINNESDQDVLFLTQNENDTSNRNLVMLHTGAQSGYALQILFMDHQGVGRGSIKNNTSSTQYNTSSDYRLKENEVEISDGIERIKQLKPYRFNWKNRPDTIVDGFFAHEVQDIVKDCVDGTKDEVYTEDNDELKIKAGDPKYQQMDHSKLVPLLTAALKETITEIETLKAKVAALEG